MKKGVLSFILLTSIFGILCSSSLVLAANSSYDVVIINCETKTSAPGQPIKVAASSSSTAAPVINQGTECAQALAHVLNEKFRIVKVKASDTSLSVLYILTRENKDTQN